MLVHSWMIQNSLKMNDDKSEVLLITPKRIDPTSTVPDLLISEHRVKFSSCVRALGIRKDAHSTMEVR